MFFKRSKKNNQTADADAVPPSSDEAGAEAAGTTTAEAENIVASGPPAVPTQPASTHARTGHAARFALSSSQLRNPMSPQALGFDDTSSLEADALPPINERAVSAIRLALALHEGSTHVLAVGAPGTGLRDTVFHIAEAETIARAAPSDWVYVTNFANPETPNALRLPSGMARKFAAAQKATLTELSMALAAAFASDDYHARHRAIHERFRGTQDEAFETLQLTAREQNIAVLRAPTGYALAPTLDGKVVKPEVFAKLPPTMQADVNKKIEKLEADLATILANEPKAERARRLRLSELDADVAEPIVAATINEFLHAFAELDSLKHYLSELAADLVENVALFRDAVPATEGRKSAKISHRYGVLVVADGQSSSSPVKVFDPLSQTLSGTIAGGGNRSGSGPHISQLRPSVLHIANGGVLIIEASDLLADPAERQALREVLRSGRIGFRRGRGPERAAALASLDPEPVPLEATIIVIAEPRVAQALKECDPTLTSLLSAKAGFADAISIDGDAYSHFSTLVAIRANREKLRPVTADAVACLIDEAVREAAAPGSIALHMDVISALLREADARAAGEARAKIEHSDVALAADETRRRAWSPAPHSRMWPSIDNSIENSAPAIGRATYLAAAQHDQFCAQSSPCPVLARVTASLSHGAGRPEDFTSVSVSSRKNETGKSSAPLVWSALISTLDPGTEVSVTALFAHENDLGRDLAGELPGSDRAAAECCALLSALSQTPVEERIALAATLRPSGELGSLPRINDAIEFAFDAMTQAGPRQDLSSSPVGVVIAASDKQRLMLAGRVVEAVQAGAFNVWVARDVVQAFTILRAAGSNAAAQADGDASSTADAIVEPAWMPAVLRGLARFSTDGKKASA